jgi:hypothetical protein
VLPPLAKYRADPKGGGGTRAEARRACEASVGAEDVEFRTEAAIHAASVARLDVTLAAARAAGVAVGRLLDAFSRHLDAAMTLGARRMSKAGAHQQRAASADTLIMSPCARRCAVAALNGAVRLRYDGAEAPRPYAHRRAAPDP